MNCKELLAIDNLHTIPQSSLDCGPGLGDNTTWTTHPLRGW